MAMTIATIGRRMKKFAMRLLPAGGRRGRSRSRRRLRLGLDLHLGRGHGLAVLDLLDALHHHAVSRRQTALDDPELADALAGLDRAEGGLAVRVDDRDA